jgi:hypothetical protein
MENIDALTDLGRYYHVDVDGRPVTIKAASHPFSMEDIKRCAHCRGSLRDIARYGRLVRRALLDESTKRLILYLNGEYVPLAQEVPRQIQLRQEASINERLPWSIIIDIGDTRSNQCMAMREILDNLVPGSWKAILETRKRVNDYCHRAGP